VHSSLPGARTRALYTQHLTPLPSAPPRLCVLADWWEASLEVPASAAVVDFVVAYYDHYDNNGGQDHRMVVDLPSGAASPEAWADGLEGGLREGLRAARLAAAAAEAARQAEREAVRQAARDKVEAVRRLQMRHVLYTEPAEPAAGREVTLFYNPSNTCLHGAARVFLRGGYNRWRHPKGFGPLEMSPPAPGASHFSATVALPKDAYSLDFVFADAQEGGRCDNASGLDYHLAAGGSVVAEPPLYVVHVAVEMAPVAKVGGLGDVVTALARAVQEGGHQVEVILPRYDFFLGSPLLAGHMAYETEFDLGGTRVFVSTAMVEGVRVWLLEPSNRLFATATVYLGKSDEARFEFFSRAALEFLLRTGRQPDVLHCHDWSTADVAKAYWSEYHWYGLWKPAVVFTIHNLEFGAAKIGEAAYYCQRFTTVSPSYAGEVRGMYSRAAGGGGRAGGRLGSKGRRRRRRRRPILTIRRPPLVCRSAGTPPSRPTSAS
jgi:starch synthase